MAIVNRLPVGGGGLKKDLLWSNPSPTAEFGGQSVSCNLSNYDYIYIRFATSTTATQQANDVLYDIEKINVSSSSVPFVFGGMLSFMVSSSTSMRIRPLRIVNRSNVTFYAGRLVESSSSSINNRYCIPLEIYGVKGTIQ